MKKVQSYQKELEKIMREEEQGKRLLLHSCCAPCSSYVLDYLSSFFAITVFYDNSNITDLVEYGKRVDEQKRFVTEFNERANPLFPVMFIEGNYKPEEFFLLAKGFESCKEGGLRCELCYRLRLENTAKHAKKDAFDYFATTLTISPLKNTVKLNEIGYALEQEIGVSYLPSDFKKKDGYKRSIELSNLYGLYRQTYCGCCFSKNKEGEMILEK